jgi:DNA polymerase IV
LWKLAVPKIIHIDMDAFFASVEQRDNPKLAGKPVVVGGPPHSRGVVASASYEARKFGIRSAMPSSHAYRLCPQVRFIVPRFDAYRESSRTVMEILREYSDLVEPVSIDEAYLDVTENKAGIEYASTIAKELKRRIYTAVSLTASAGVAPNKFLAKLASDMQKPNGLTVISPERINEVLENLPVSKLPGVGPVTEERLERLGIRSTRELREKSRQDLQQLFGKNGDWFFDICRGIDHRQVVSLRTRKSLSAEDTFREDTSDLHRLEEELLRLAGVVWERLASRPGRTVTLKVKYSDFEIVTRRTTYSDAVESEARLAATAIELMRNTEAGSRPVRLLGIGVSGFPDDDEPAQPAREATGTALSSFPMQLEFLFSRR